MKKVLFIGLITLSYTTIFSQIPELKSASDKAKEKIQQENKQQRKVSSPADFVNPFIGTGGHGHTYPGATAPFGMMQLSPDTRFDGWDGCSGYHYSDSIIYGFSHTHLSGTGVSDLADILVVPQQHKVSTDPLHRSATGYGSLFSHTQEKAEPGFYSVKLLKNNIDVRLTTTDRCGMHEYTFNDKKGKKYLVIDLTHRDEVLSSDIKVEGSNKIVGHRHSKSWAKNQQLYFQLETNVPFTKHEIVKKLNSYVLVLEFSEETNKILLKTGISAVDLKGARSN
jgi:putative alpha-1,2-mannosidase